MFTSSTFKRIMTVACGAFLTAGITLADQRRADEPVGTDTGKSKIEQFAGLAADLAGDAPALGSKSGTAKGAPTIGAGQPSKPIGICPGPLVPPTKRGDVNCDGFVDNGDIDAFTLAIIDPAAWATMHPTCDYLNADLNGDGVVDNADVGEIGALLAPSTDVRGDVNCDGFVNNGDLDAFVIAMLSDSVFESYYRGCSHSRADVNGDGSVDNADMQAFIDLLVSQG